VATTNPHHNQTKQKTPLKSTKQPKNTPKHPTHTKKPQPHKKTKKLQKTKQEMWLKRGC
jgi:hypothetical protein